MTLEERRAAIWEGLEQLELDIALGKYDTEGMNLEEQIAFKTQLRLAFLSDNGVVLEESTYWPVTSLPYDEYREKIGLAIFEQGLTATAPLVEPEVPASEAWLYANPEALASVRRGLEDSKHGRVSKVDLASLDTGMAESASGQTVDLGSFAQYVEPAGNVGKAVSGMELPAEPIEVFRGPVEGPQ